MCRAPTTSPTLTPPRPLQGSPGPSSLSGARDTRSARLSATAAPHNVRWTSEGFWEGWMRRGHVGCQRLLRILPPALLDALPAVSHLRVLSRGTRSACSSPLRSLRSLSCLNGLSSDMTQDRGPARGGCGFSRSLSCIVHILSSLEHNTVSSGDYQAEVGEGRGVRGVLPLSRDRVLAPQTSCS